MHVAGQFGVRRPHAREYALSRPLTRPALLLATVLLAGGLVPTAAAAPTAKVTERVRATTPTVAPSGDQYFVPSSRTTAGCKGAESIVGLGLASADRYLASSTMGWTGLEAYAVGDAGKADIRWQLLCAKNVKVKIKRATGKAVIAGTNVATAKATCPSGHAAVPLPFAQDFAPFLGDYDLSPRGNGWQATLTGFPDQVAAVQPNPVNLNVLCIPASKVSYPSQSGVLDAGGQLSGTLACPAGRPLGFGFHVGSYTSYPSATNSAVPMVRKARLTGSALDFAIGTKAPDETAAGDPVTVSAVCGVPKAHKAKKKPKKK